MAIDDKLEKVMVDNRLRYRGKAILDRQTLVIERLA